MFLVIHFEMKDVDTKRKYAGTEFTSGSLHNAWLFLQPHET